MGELRQAIDKGQLTVHYQPKIDLKTRQICGAEALIRWAHPEHGILLPDEFIGLAEQTGLIKPMTLWVLETALHECARWRKEGFEIELAVNLSARNLQDLKFPETMKQIINKCGLPAEVLSMEVTESAIMSDPVRAMKIIESLDQFGVRLSIDDFGTGYSSLAYLKDLPADELKIDKSFVVDMTENESNKMIVESTIGLAHNLGLKVVAEGIESEEVCQLLTSLNCDIGQGFLFSRPLPIDNFIDLLKSSARKEKLEV